MKWLYKNIIVTVLCLCCCYQAAYSQATYPEVTGFEAARSYDEIVLHWNHYYTPNATGYHIYWSTSPGQSTADSDTIILGQTVTHTHTNLDPNQTYYYRVRALFVNQEYTALMDEIEISPLDFQLFSGGEGDGYDETHICLTDLDGSPLTYIPTGLTGASMPLAISVYWDTDPIVQEYILEVANAAAGPFTPLAQLYSAGFQHENLVGNQNYYYRLTAILKGNCPADYTSVLRISTVDADFYDGGEGDGYDKDHICLGFLNGDPDLPAPVGLEVAASHGENVLFWNPTPDATNYIVEYSTDQINFSVVGSTNNISFNHEGISQGTTYYYRITAEGSGVCPFGYSDTISAEPREDVMYAGGVGDGYDNDTSCAIDLDGNSQAPVPSGLTVAGGYDQNVIYWDFLPGALQYYLQFTTDPLLGYTLLDSTDNIMYIHTGLTPGVTYYYQVSADFGGDCPAGFSPPESGAPVVQADIFKGGIGDGHDMSSSCNIDLDGNSAVAPPEGFEVAASHHSNVLFWDPYSGVSEFIIYWSNSSSGPFNLLTSTNDISYVHDNLDPSLDYFYRVEASFGGTCPGGLSAINGNMPVEQAYMKGGIGDGHDMFTSCPSSLNGDTVLYAPTGFTVAAGLNQNYIYWDFLPGATHYILEFSTDPFTGFTAFPPITDISFVHEGLSSNVTYYYRLTSEFAQGCPAGFTGTDMAEPVAQADIFKGGIGDGYDMTTSCFWSPLDGLTPPLVAVDSVICSSDPVLLETDAADGYQWLLNNQPIAGANSSSYQATEAGFYSVFIQNLTGCWVKSFQIEILEGDTLPLPVVPDGEPLVCEGTTHMYTIQAVPGATTYVWEAPGGAIISGSGTEVDITFGSNSGNVQVMAQNACGNTAPVPLHVDVIPITQGIWTGTINRDWHIDGNWGCGSVPTPVTDVLIPAQPVNQPIIYNNNTGVCRSIWLDPGASLDIETNAVLRVND
ncbi:MAG: hypothetical protein EA412_01905 [Chitinophagaceae bacterium]|nr:MAG: hypothetical protein EA412_01905 [Chitinophagaceae bacterium]